MKKKFLVALLLALGVCGGAFALSACNSGNNDNSDNPSISDGDTETSVRGKTYVFYDVEISFSSEVPEEIKNEMNNSLAALKQNMEGESLSFNTDGNAYISGNAIGTWVQDGETVTVTQSDGSVQTITVKGDNVEVTTTQSGITITTVFKYNPGGGDHGGGADNPGSSGDNSDISDTEWEAALNFTANTNYTLVQNISIMGMSMSLSIVREGDRAMFTNTDGTVTYYCEREGSYYYVGSSGAYSQITETEYNAFFSQLQSFPRDMFEYNSAKGGFVNKATYEVNGATISNVVLVFNQQGCVQSIQCTMAQSGVTAALNVSVVYGNASVTLPDFNEGGDKPGEDNPGDKPGEPEPEQPVDPVPEAPVYPQPENLDWEAAFNFTINTNYVMTEYTVDEDNTISIVTIERDGNKAKIVNSYGEYYLGEVDGKYYQIYSSDSFKEITEADYISYFYQYGMPQDKFTYSAERGGYVNAEEYVMGSSYLKDALVIFDTDGCLAYLYHKNDNMISVREYYTTVEYGKASVTLPELNIGATDPVEPTDPGTGK